MPSSAQKLKDIVERWQGARVLVAGDVMLDHFVQGEVTRISPEAPVPIVNFVSEINAPGGAANAASNIKTLGGEVLLCGVIGDDEAANHLTAELRNRCVSFYGIVDPERPTTTKTRYFVHNQQLMRYDREERSPLGHTLQQRLQTYLREMIRSVRPPDAWRAVVISDYAKGVLSHDLIADIIACARQCGTPVIGDAKPQNIKAFRGATVLTPNEDEMRSIMRSVHVDDCCHVARMLETSFLVTLGERGSMLVDADSLVYCRTIPRAVFDMVGAGDTVVAAVSLALTVGASFPDAARLANAAAGVVVGKRGTATVSVEELLAAIDEVEERGAACSNL